MYGNYTNELGQNQFFSLGCYQSTTVCSLSYPTCTYNCSYVSISLSSDQVCLSSGDGGDPEGPTRR